MLAGLAAASSAASLTASGATGCTFKGASWEFEGRTGTTYTVTVLRGVCAQAAAVARPLTHRRSQGLRKRVPAPRGWLCLSFPLEARSSRAATARLGARVAWQPADGKAPGGVSRLRSRSRAEPEHRVS